MSLAMWCSGTRLISCIGASQKIQKRAGDSTYIKRIATQNSAAEPNPSSAGLRQIECQDFRRLASLHGKFRLAGNRGAVASFQFASIEFHGSSCHLNPRVTAGRNGVFGGVSFA